MTVGAAVLASVPDCGGDEPWWEFRHFELALLPALADFLPLLWILSRTAEVRHAGLIAGGIGAVRYGILQGSTFLASAASVGPAGKAHCTISVFYLAGLIVLMGIVYAASAVFVAGLLGWRWTKSSRAR